MERFALAWNLINKLADRQMVGGAPAGIYPAQQLR